MIWDKMFILSNYTHVVANSDIIIFGLTLSQFEVKLTLLELTVVDVLTLFKIL